jgi:hypothetical protein
MEIVMTFSFALALIVLVLVSLLVEEDLALGRAEA